MAWIEQTKKASRKSGGPQYYLQGLSENTKGLLGVRKRCPVRLWTPYGVVDAKLQAVSHRVGMVGHDRVQRASRKDGGSSVAEQVAHWYKFRSKDIETIEFSDFLDDKALVICPTQVTFFSSARPHKITRDIHPLTLTANHRSQLLLDHFRRNASGCRACGAWARAQVGEIVAAHAALARSVDERDLLRASGALHRVGINLGVYRNKGIDCAGATFQLCGYEPYPCPVEIEERSSGFLHSHHDAHRKQRAVVVCMEHDARGALGDYVDVIELRELARALEESA